jgi:cobalt-zinc-cadmium efflux system outer membrane protein
MTRPRPAALAAALALAAAASAARAQTASVLPADPVLEQLVSESLAARPELRQAEALARGERERVPQAGALPDPVLSLGIQNDGFRAIEVGKMETSYYQVMLSQGLPWPGKRGLRTDVARLGADQAEASVARIRLATEAAVRRAYLDLLLARDRLALLGKLEGIWQKSAGIARVRYEAGDGAQSDVLRAQLELNRLKQRRWTLQAQERGSLQALNRLRNHPLDEPIATRASVRDLPVPALPAPDAALQDALARSPELAQARLGASRAEKQVDLARRERYPDLGVSAGVMPRGSLDPMWLATVSIGLPIWSGRKQSRAVDESAARADAEAQGLAAVEQTLRQRVAERSTALSTLSDTVRLYREGLLVQSQATAESTLAQYRVGKVTFASVLDANAGYVNDEEGLLSAIADTERVAIASAEVSLDPVALGGSAGLGGAAVPGAGAIRAAAATASAGGGAAAGGAASSSGGMAPGM